MEPSTLGPTLSDEPQLEPAEIDLLEVLLRDYGFDYHNAPSGWLHQRIANRVVAEQLQTVKGLREKIFHDEACRQRLLRNLTQDADAMFYEPAFYRAFRTAVVPFLRTYPFVGIWHVCCSTGE